MPKINFGIADGADIEAAQGFPVYKGELPQNGVYEGILKVLKVEKIANGDNKGKNRLQIVVTIDDPNYPEYKGAPAFDNKNLTDQGVPYVNQFLEALTDGSDKARAAVKRAFWKTGPIVDDAKEHILRIGTVKVESPKGELRVLISTKLNTYQGNTSARIQQWMLSDGEGVPAEETEVVEAEDEDDSVAEVDTEAEDAESEEDSDEDAEDEDPYEDEEEAEDATE